MIACYFAHLTDGRGAILYTSTDNDPLEIGFVLGLCIAARSQTS